MPVPISTMDIVLSSIGERSMHSPGWKGIAGHVCAIIVPKASGQRITVFGSRFSRLTGEPLTPTAATARSAAKRFLDNSIVVVEGRRAKSEVRGSQQNVWDCRGNHLYRSLDLLYASGLFVKVGGWVRPNTEISQGPPSTGQNHKQRHRGPPEPNPAELKTQGDHLSNQEKSRSAGLFSVFLPPNLSAYRPLT